MATNCQHYSGQQDTINPGQVAPSDRPVGQPTGINPVLQSLPASDDTTSGPVPSAKYRTSVLFGQQISQLAAVRYRYTAPPAARKTDTSLEADCLIISAGFTEAGSGTR